MKKRVGFTLIELLVVIAIIALLLAILLPSLNKVKEKAKEIVCRMHLKGIGMALLLYLEDSDGRAFDSGSNNSHIWYDASGNYLDPTSDYCYWGLGYIDYAEDPKVFGCPSFRLVFDMLYENDPTVTVELAPYAGYGLNAHFFTDPELPTGHPLKEIRKVTTVKSPFQFIVTQDHVEPRHEGTAHGADQGDQLFMTSTGQPNLAHYRPPRDRARFYWGIFRHSKRSRALDEEAEHQKRLTAGTIDSSPNGRCNLLFLDGHSEGVSETIGGNIRESWYTGL